MNSCLRCKHYDVGVCRLKIPLETANDWMGCKYFEDENKIRNLFPRSNNFCKDCKYYGVPDICRNIENKVFDSKYPKIHQYAYCSRFEKRLSFLDILKSIFKK